MTWGSWASFTQETPVSDGTWTNLDELVTANPREIINIEIEADNLSGTVTDALRVRAQAAVVDSPTVATDADWTNEPVFQRSFLPGSVAAEDFAFSLYGYRHYRIQVQAAGATDDYTVNGKWRGDGVSA